MKQSYYYHPRNFNPSMCHTKVSERFISSLCFKQNSKQQLFYQSKQESPVEEIDCNYLFSLKVASDIFDLENFKGVCSSITAPLLTQEFKVVDDQSRLIC